MPYITTERVAAIRKQLKAKFPEIKFSVTKRHWSVVDVAIMESPYDWPEPYQDLNVYYLGRYPHSDILRAIHKIMNEGNGTLVHDGDYGAVPRFYTRLSIGRWDKPHVKREKAQ